MSNDLTAEDRTAVFDRDNGQCQRCFQRGGHIHHRRRRGIRDSHTHCGCNTILLCGECHNWVHGHPEEARRLGFIVSVWDTNPGMIPVLDETGFSIWGPRRYLACWPENEREE